MEEYRFQHPLTNQDYQQLYEVMRKSFGDEDVVSILRRFVEKHMEMSDEEFFMVKKGDEAVSGLVLLPQKWSIDGVEFKVAEMGCVGTVPKHRRKGTQRILNSEFDKLAEKKGFDLCVLAGIPYFYRQFGYQYAVELDYETKIKSSLLPKETRLTRRKFKDCDIDEAQTLLEKVQSRYYVHSIRTHEIWRYQQETETYGGEQFKATAILDDCKLVAYYRWWNSDEAFTIKELSVSEEAYLPDLAACIREEATEQGAETIKTKLSEKDAFSKYLTNLGAEKNKPYAWQVKILDPQGFLKKLGPVLEKRLKESKFKGLTRDLRINFWKYALCLCFRDGRLENVERIDKAERVIAMNPYAAIQLFLGYRSRSDLEYAYPDFYIREGNDVLIDVLFPRKPGYIHYCY